MSVLCDLADDHRVERVSALKDEYIVLLAVQRYAPAARLVWEIEHGQGHLLAVEKVGELLREKLLINVHGRFKIDLAVFVNREAVLWQKVVVKGNVICDDAALEQYFAYFQGGGGLARA